MTQATEIQPTILLVHAAAPKHTAVCEHRIECDIAKGASKNRNISTHPKWYAADLKNEGYKINRCQKCLPPISGPGLYVPDSQRHTERVTLRLKRQDMEILKGAAKEMKTTLANVVAVALRAAFGGGR